MARMVRSPVGVVVGGGVCRPRPVRVPRPAAGRPRGYEPAGLVEFCNCGLPYVELVVFPIPLTEMITEMIRASTTAYSTAVGPSSLFRKATACRANRPSMASLREIAGVEPFLPPAACRPGGPAPAPGWGRFRVGRVSGFSSTSPAPSA